jgi:hypothetical protein
MTPVVPVGGSAIDLDFRPSPPRPRAAVPSVSRWARRRGPPGAGRAGRGPAGRVSALLEATRKFSDLHSIICLYGLIAPSPEGVTPHK